MDLYDTQILFQKETWAADVAAKECDYCMS